MGKFSYGSRKHLWNKQQNYFIIVLKKANQKTHYF